MLYAVQKESLYYVINILKHVYFTAVLTIANNATAYPDAKKAHGPGRGVRPPGGGGCSPRILRMRDVPSLEAPSEFAESISGCIPKMSSNLRMRANRREGTCRREPRLRLNEMLNDKAAASSVVLMRLVGTAG